MNQAKIKVSYHHGDLREALLQAAEELLDEAGLPALSLRACARRAGVSHAAPKHHFTDLADLVAEVAARSFDRLNEALRVARAAAGSDPEARFVATVRTYVRFAWRQPDHFRLMFRTDVLNQHNAAFQQASSRTFAELADSVTLLRGEPDVDPEELLQRVQDGPLQQALMLGWSYAHGFAQLLLEGQLGAFIGEQDLDRFIDDAIGSTGVRLAALLREPASSAE